MKTSKIVMLLAFIFCVSLSQTATAAISQSDAALSTVIAKDSKKNTSKTFRKVLKKQFAKVLKAKKDVKKFLKETKENASTGKLLLLALVGLVLLGLGGLLGLQFIAGIGGLLITIAVVWWILQLVGVI